jgi:hypothetical protein
LETETYYAAFGVYCYITMLEYHRNNVVGESIDGPIRNFFDLKLYTDNNIVKSLQRFDESGQRKYL